MHIDLDQTLWFEKHIIEKLKTTLLESFGHLPKIRLSFVKDLVRYTALRLYCEFGLEHEYTHAHNHSHGMRINARPNSPVQAGYINIHIVRNHSFPLQTFVSLKIINFATLHPWRSPHSKCYFTINPINNVCE